jgi:hypothetical protein
MVGVLTLERWADQHAHRAPRPVDRRILILVQLGIIVGGHWLQALIHTPHIGKRTTCRRQ